MNAKDILMRLLYGKLIRNKFDPYYFLFEYSGEYCTLTTRNYSATALLKIRCESNVKSEPKVLDTKDLLNSNFNYHEVDDELMKQATTFDTSLFDKEGYHKCYYSELNNWLDAGSDHKKMCLEIEGDDISKSLVGVGTSRSLVDMAFLKSIFLKYPSNGLVFLKASNDEQPVFVNYEYDCFDVYAVVAPLVTDFYKADVMFRVR